MPTLSDILQRDRNNVDLIRVLAALSVMVGHCYGLQPASGRVEPVLWFTKGESFGSFAVFAFFILSGMLVSASWDRQRSTLHFLALRLARIWPALAVCAAVTAFVVGPAVSWVPTWLYLTTPPARDWFLHVVSLVDGRVQFLPGVFEHNPAGAAVNGPLWSLPVEFKCYLVVLLGGVLGAIGSRRGTVLVVAAALALFAVVRAFPPSSPALADLILRPPGYKLYPFPFFLLGMLLYAFRDRVFISGRLAAALLVTYVATRLWAADKPAILPAVAHSPLLYLAFVSGLLWVAASPLLHRIRIRNDYSYGIYLYGFVVQQVVAGIAPTLDSYVSLLITVPVTVAVAAASWHLVERPCLRWVRGRYAPAPRVVAAAHAA